MIYASTLLKGNAWCCLSLMMVRISQKQQKARSAKTSNT